MTNRYRKLPVEIEAVQFDGTPQSVLAVMHFVDAGRTEKELRIHADSDPAKSWIGIPTLEGTMRADAGDWIIRGVKGELHPCKPDVFAVTYEAAAVSAAVAPPTNRAALRETIADTLALRENPPGPDGRAWYPDEQHRESFLEAADAVLAVLPTTDRTAVLREADWIVEHCPDHGCVEPATEVCHCEIADRLRRMADETATETPAPDDRRLHACTEHGTWFDRSVCAEPCGAMHTRCTNCGVALDACPHQPAAGARQDGAES